jgi:transcriptional regulator with XRE-family HTH domain
MLVDFGAELGRRMADGGVSQAKLGVAVGRAQTTVSDWVLGNAEPPASVVFDLERILALAPGTLSRHLGYLPLEVYRPTFEDAVRVDPDLTQRERAFLLAGYRALKRKGR